MAPIYKLRLLLCSGFFLAISCASSFRPLPPAELTQLDANLPLPEAYALELQGRLGWRAGEEAWSADFLLRSGSKEAHLEVTSPLGPKLAELDWGPRGIQLPPGNHLPAGWEWLPQEAGFLRELAWGRALGPDWLQGEPGHASWGKLQVQWEGEFSPALPVASRILLVGPEGERLTLVVRQARLGFWP